MPTDVTPATLPDSRPLHRLIARTRRLLRSSWVATGLGITFGLLLGTLAVLAVLDLFIPLEPITLPLLDVVGQNYRENEILAAHAQKPTRRIIGTENQHGREVWLALRDHAPYAGQLGGKRAHHQRHRQRFRGAGHVGGNGFERTAMHRIARSVLFPVRQVGLPLAPTFIPFHPWTTIESYRALLRTLVELDLHTQVAPIQLAIRLLIPEGSLLLELPEIRKLVGLFDARALYYPWRHPDAALDALCGRVQETIKREEKRRTSRAGIFRQIWDLAGNGEFPDIPMVSRATIAVTGPP